MVWLGRAKWWGARAGLIQACSVTARQTAQTADFITSGATGLMLNRVRPSFIWCHQTTSSLTRWYDTPEAVAEEDELVAAREEIQRLRLLVQMLTKQSPESSSSHELAERRASDAAASVSKPSTRPNFALSTLAHLSDGASSPQPEPTHTHPSPYFSQWPTFPPQPPSQYPSFTATWDHQPQYTQMGQNFAYQQQFAGQFGGKSSGG